MANFNRPSLGRAEGSLDVEVQVDAWGGVLCQYISATEFKKSEEKISFLASVIASKKTREVFVTLAEHEDFSQRIIEWMIRRFESKRSTR